MLVPGVEGANKTVAASPNISALLNFAPHPIVFPLRSLRGRQKAKPLLHIAILTAQVDATGGTDKSVFSVAH